MLSDIYKSLPIPTPMGKELFIRLHIFYRLQDMLHLVNRNIIDDLKPLVVEAKKSVLNINNDIEKLIHNNIGIFAEYAYSVKDNSLLVNTSRELLENTDYIPTFVNHPRISFDKMSELIYGSDQPLYIMFMLSENCNLNCTYCYEHHNDTSILTLSDAKAFIDNVFTCTDAHFNVGTRKSIILEFMGGEPLLHAGLINEIIQYFYSACVRYKRFDWLILHRFNITTNGTLYFESDVQKLLNSYPQMNLILSLDGTKEYHDANRVYKDGSGSFDDVVNAIKVEITKGVLNPPRMTLTRASIKHLCTNILSLSKLGINMFRSELDVNSTFTESDACEYYSQLIMIVDYIHDSNKKELLDVFNCTSVFDRDGLTHFCVGEGDMLTVLPNGKYSTCHRMHDYANSKHSICIGDTSSGILSSSEHIANYYYIQDNNTRNRQFDDKCLDCPFIGKCITCPAHDFESLGEFSSRVSTNHCFMNLAEYAARVYYQAKINGKIDTPYIKKYKDKFNMFLPESEISTLAKIEELFTYV